MIDTWKHYSKSNQIQQVQAGILIDSMKSVIDELPNEISVLDYGMGDGTVTEEKLINQFIDRQYKIFGVDINENQVQAAKKRFAGNENVAVGLVDEINLEKYDLIFSNAALHWVIDRENPVSTLRAFYDYLKPGGWFAFQQGGLDAYRGLHQKTRAAAKQVLGTRYSEVFDNWEPPLYYPSANELKTELEQAGFEVYAIIDDIIEVDDSVETETLIDNFANASFSAYEERLKEKNCDCYAKRIKDVYKKLCLEGSLDKYNHRITAIVRRPR